MRVLLVEDDRMIGDAVSLGLKDASHAVDWVMEGESALSALRTQSYDLMLLDLGLPGQDGLQVLQRLRSGQSRMPVIILTARDSVDDRIQGLDSGADDYLVKPFELGELLARMRAVERRQAGVANPVLSNGELVLDTVTHEAQFRDGGAVRLSNREFALLQALLMRPGAILSRGVLEDRIYGWGQEVESNAVEYLIHSLRKKLGSDAIRNVRGVGWMTAKGE